MPAMRNVALSLILICLLLSTKNIAQQNKSIKSQQQFWLGYITSAQITERIAIWNDFHFVPKGFWVARTGLTWQWQNASVTGGFAYLGLPLSASNRSLRRNEYRPWAQITWNTVPQNDSRFTLNTRIRYDARFRQDVENGNLTEEYPFTNRVRVALSARYKLKPLGKNWQPFLNAGTELLLNFGKHVTFNTFDQFRINGTIGISTGSVSLQSGYMYRLVQTGPFSYVGNHTLLCWVNHRINLVKAPKS
jgi:hypothetical protein